jgi:hypothetical protein
MSPYKKMKAVIEDNLSGTMTCIKPWINGECEEQRDAKLSTTERLLYFTSPLTVVIRHDIDKNILSNTPQNIWGNNHARDYV